MNGECIHDNCMFWSRNLTIHTFIDCKGVYMFLECSVIWYITFGSLRWWLYACQWDRPFPSAMIWRYWRGQPTAADAQVFFPFMVGKCQVEERKHEAARTASEHWMSELRSENVWPIGWHGKQFWQALTHALVGLYTYVYIYIVYIYMYEYIYIYLYVCMYEYLYIYHCSTSSSTLSTSSTSS